jgi:hypothetical protein
MALYPFEKPKGLYIRRITRTKLLVGFSELFGADAMVEMSSSQDLKSCQVESKDVSRVR